MGLTELKEGVGNRRLVDFVRLKKIILWLTAPKGATPVNWTSATDWQAAL